MRLYIDGNEVDIDQNTVISISFSVADITELDVSKIVYTKNILLPVTSRNMGIFCNAEDVNNLTVFNRIEHTAVIEEKGCAIMEGVPLLTETQISVGGNSYYRINILGPGRKWISAARQTAIRELDIPFGITLNATSVEDSWKGSQPVRFLPVQRSDAEVQNETANIFLPLRVLTYDDYHPFIHLRTLLEYIFRDSGYTLESSFIGSDFFDTLYISGRYTEKNTELIRSRMNFKAGRFAASQTTADSRGRVYADPYRAASTVGNIVDTADPAEMQGGVVVSDVFDMGECFGYSADRIVFTPKYEVNASFEYTLSFTADTYIKNRQELGGFNLINLGEGFERSFKITNRYEDKKEDPKFNRNYSLVLFNYDPQITYALYTYELINPNYDPEDPSTLDYDYKFRGYLGSKVNNVTFTNGYQIMKVMVYYQPYGSSGLQIYSGDWALYNGYIAETNRVDVEITVKSIPEKITPSNPKFFDRIYFGGAESGMFFRLNAATRIRPVFRENPGEGSEMGFGDVAVFGTNGLKLLKSVQHLFNLIFITDEPGKKVMVEPRSSFYDKNIVTDWSAKVDYSKPIKASDMASQINRSIILKYSDEDRAVEKWNRNNDQDFAGKQYAIDNKLAAEGSKVYSNPLFNASISENGILSEAENAYLIKVDPGEDEDSLNFPVKIVSYLGMQPLPNSQIWGWPSYGSKYPFVTFHFSGTGINESEAHGDQSYNEMLYADGVSLCFGSRDGLNGLGPYYDQIGFLYNEGKRIELYMDLRPVDIEPFIRPNKSKNDFRSLYKLGINGEDQLYILEKICDYNPLAMDPTKCIFLKYN